jgi:hypothetical protein
MHRRDDDPHTVRERVAHNLRKEVGSNRGSRRTR